MDAATRLKLLERFKGLPSLTDAEARIAAQPNNEREEQYITQRLWSVAAAVREAFERRPANRSEYVKPVFKPVEPERERDF